MEWKITSRSKINHKFNFNRAIELNTCGVTQQIKLCFLFNKNIKPNLHHVGAFDNEPTAPNFQTFSKTQNVSDKIKNEILPLLNGSDDDIDELDDEVAMISNKRGPSDNRYKVNDAISMDDIKISIKGELVKPSKELE